MSKHTPGPWFSRKGTRDGTWKVYDIEDQEGLLLAEVVKSYDARLIAAAPDLLAACEEALLAMDALDVGTSLVSDHIRAAIAKAKGDRA